ncbi:uncharacterized protein LOC104456665 [Eucalyptus grandis]|uniref:uncharacterized protein LOC104456665 n=1 Tax=Eucalyptus grandis TaxID=71139 RepID=UPI00192ECED6|nr:uncharacterized protein LOC104456665 [Eucalyptus grandis]
MLAKRLGPDVREGKRRQFNFIGKLLREVEPELMDASIEATEDDDQSRLRALLVSEAWVGKDNDERERRFRTWTRGRGGDTWFLTSSLQKKKKKKKISALPSAATQSFICILFEENEFSMYGRCEKSASQSPREESFTSTSLI